MDKRTDKPVDNEIGKSKGLYIKQRMARNMFKHS